MTGATLTFTVPGRPVPKMRARVYYDKRLGKIRAVTPQKTRDYENAVGIVAAAKRPASWPKDVRYAVTVEAHIAKVKGTKRPRRLDLDNIEKSVLDGCNKILWDDDSQIDLLTTIRFNTDDECTKVRVTAIPEDE